MKKTFSFILSLTIVLGSLFLVLEAPSSVAALTKAQKTQCFKDWNGEQMKTISEKYDKYIDSKCADITGGNCHFDAKGVDAVGSVSCQKPAANPGGDPGGDPGGNPGGDPGGEDGFIQGGDKSCAGVSTSLIDCSSGKTGVEAFAEIVLVVVNFLSIGVGTIIVGAIVVGGMRYASANGNASQAQQGITIIVNAVIALLLFAFTYALVNYLVPGGVFTTS